MDTHGVALVLHTTEKTREQRVTGPIGVALEGSLLLADAFVHVAELLLVVANAARCDGRGLVLDGSAAPALGDLALALALPTAHQPALDLDEALNDSTERISSVDRGHTACGALQDGEHGVTTGEA